MKFGNNIDLDFNELQNPLLHNISSEPTGVQNARYGLMYFDTGSILKPRYWDGTTWRTIIDDRASGITNAMLAGNIANSKLVNSSITIAGTSVSLGGSIAADTITGAATKLGTADKGSQNIPIYLNAGVPTEITSLAVTKGGTGLTSVSSGKMLYASASNTFSTVSTNSYGRSLLGLNSMTLWGQSATVSSSAIAVSGNMTGVGTVTFSQMKDSSTNSVLEVVNVGTSQSPVWALHTNLPFYSDDWVASGGINASAGSGGGHNLITWSEIPAYYSSSIPTADQESADVASAWATKQLYSKFSDYVLISDLLTNGKIKTTYLPSYVDDVLEYSSLSAFPATGESGKIYIAIDTNKTYRWGGSGYVEISSSLALGETSSTAYRGDRGKIAYDHSQISSGNPHGTTVSSLSDTVISSPADGQALIYDSSSGKWKNADIGDVFALNNAIAENRSRIEDIEGWLESPFLNTMRVKSLDVESVNLGGVELWNEGTAAVLGGCLTARMTGTYDSFIKAENGNGQIALLTSSNRGVYDFSTSRWLITTNGTDTRLSCGNVAIGDSFNSSYTLHVTGTIYSSEGLHLRGDIATTSSTGDAGRIIRFGNNSYLELIDLGSGQSPRYALHSSVPIYSDYWISSGGIGSNSGGGGGGGHNLVSWSELPSYYSSTTPTADQEAEDVASAWAVKKVYEQASSALQTVSTSPTTDSNPAYVVTGLSKSGTAVAYSRAAIYYNKVSLNGSTQSIVTSSNTAVSFFAPTTAGTAGYYLKSNGSGAPTWDGIRHIDLSSISEASSLNTMISSPGLEVRRLGNVSDAPSSYSYGSVIQWSRYVDATGNSVNTASQLYVPYQQNKLFFRNSWATGHSPTGDEWKPWLEVATIAADGTGSLASNLIHSFTVSASRVAYSTGYVFSTKNLVTALYDNNEKLVITDVTIMQDTTSSSSTYGKYRVSLNFAKTTTVAYRLVVYGI